VAPALTFDAPGRGCVLELLGPAGAGKSAVCNALLARPGVSRASVWRLPRRLLLSRAPAALRDAARWRGHGRWRAAGAGSTIQVAKQILRLDALHASLEKRREGGVLVLDEGPLFALAWLRVFAQARPRDDVAPARWWMAAIERCARAIDAVALLDAPDAVLASRIRARVKPHMVKNRSDAEIDRFTAEFRVAFARVLADLERAWCAIGRPPRIAVLSTLQLEPVALAEQIFDLVDEGARARV
jgi:hypothetical protein